MSCKIPPFVFHFSYYLCKTATISYDARAQRAILVKFYVIISRLWYQNRAKSVRILGKKFSFNVICFAISILHSRQNKQIRQLTKDSVIEQKKNFFPQTFYNDIICFTMKKNLDYSNGDETSICSRELRNSLPETKEEWVPQKKIGRIGVNQT